MILLSVVSVGHLQLRSRVSGGLPSYSRLSSYLQEHAWPFSFKIKHKHLYYLIPLSAKASG